MRLKASLSLFLPSWSRCAVSLIKPICITRELFRWTRLFFPDCVCFLGLTRVPPLLVELDGEMTTFHLTQRLKVRYSGSYRSGITRSPTICIGTHMILCSKIIYNGMYSNKSWSLAAQGLFPLRENRPDGARDVRVPLMPGAERRFHHPRRARGDNSQGFRPYPHPTIRRSRRCHPLPTPSPPN